MKNYKVIKENDRCTLGQFDKGYNAYIINDGLYKHYFWASEAEAQKAVDAYNAYTGLEWLGEHGYGNDIITLAEEENPEMLELYKLFNAVE